MDVGVYSRKDNPHKESDMENYIIELLPLVLFIFLKWTSVHLLIKLAKSPQITTGISRENRIKLKIFQIN